MGYKKLKFKIKQLNLRCGMLRADYRNLSSCVYTMRNELRELEKKHRELVDINNANLIEINKRLKKLEELNATETKCKSKERSKNNS